jgi:1,4-alpha-glucan branching enzyme
MLLKSYSKTGKKCRVTFRLSAEAEATSASVCGDFNDWDTKAHPMKQLKDGSFSRSMWLEADKVYRYRYFVNGERWENDWDADEYEKNPYGTDDSVVRT